MPEGTKPVPEPMLSSVNEAHGHLAKNNFTGIVLDITHYKVFEIYIFENIATSAKGQWINTATGPSPAVTSLKTNYEWNVHSLILY